MWRCGRTEDCHVTTGREVELMRLQAKKCQESTATPRSKEGFYPESQRESGTADTLIIDIKLPELEENNSCVVKPSRFGPLLRQP